MCISNSMDNMNHRRAEKSACVAYRGEQATGGAEKLAAMGNVLRLHGNTTKATQRGLEKLERCK